MDEEIIGTVIDLGEDLSDVREPDPLPEGRYQATVSSLEIKDSKAGNKYLSVRFSVGTDQYPVDYVNPSATSVFTNISLAKVPLALLALKKFNEATGLPMTGRIDFTAAIGSEVSITVKHEEYEGVTRATVKTISKI